MHLGLAPSVNLGTSSEGQLSFSRCPVLLPSLVYILHTELVSESASWEPNLQQYPEASPLNAFSLSFLICKWE